MKRHLFVLLACFAAHSTYAVDEVGSATPVLDPKEAKSGTFVKDIDTVRHQPATPMMPQPGNIEPGTQPIAPDDAFENDVTRRSKKLATQAPNPPSNLPSASDVAAPNKRRFMDDYCEPDFISILANNRKYFGQESCLKLIQGDACNRFKHMPKDAQEVMDDAIRCLFTNSNSYVSEKGQRVDGNSVVCADTYIKRVEMMKKYMNDYYTMYALLFIADDIMDTPGRCINRTAAPQPNKR